MTIRSIAEQRRQPFFSGKYRLRPEGFTEALGQPPHGHRFRPGHVKRHRRGAAMKQRTDRHLIGISLPNDVHNSHVQIDRTPFFYGRSYL
ncbi:hypothetical protein D3C76_1649040 [compost metagenome]